MDGPRADMAVDVASVAREDGRPVESARDGPRVADTEVAADGPPVEAEATEAVAGAVPVVGKHTNTQKMHNTQEAPPLPNVTSLHQTV